MSMPNDPTDGGAPPSAEEDTKEGIDILSAGHNEDNRRIWLRFVANNHPEEQIRVIYGHPLATSMDTYARRIEKSPYHLRFLFNGHRLYNHQSAKDAGLEDNDQIDVFEQQHGGGN